MYEARGKIDHVNDMLDAVRTPGIAVEESRLALAGRANVMMRRVDALTRFTAIRLLDNDELFDAFRREDSIDAFWALPDRKRITKFGKPLYIRPTLVIGRADIPN